MTTRPTLDELSGHADFPRRHIGPTPDELSTMLATIGVSSVEDLLARTIPPSIRARSPRPTSSPSCGPSPRATGPGAA